MRLLVLTTTFPRWANDVTPAFVYELSRRLQNNGFNIVILTPHCEGSKKFEILDGMKVYRFPYFFPEKYQKLAYDGGIIPNLKKSLLAWIQVPFLLCIETLYTIKLIKKEKIQILHSHWIIPNGFVGTISKCMFGLPHITTAHAGDVFTIERVKPLHIFGSFVLKNADIITANSNYTKNSILSINKSIENRLIILPMGIDIERFAGKSKNVSDKPSIQRNILSIGRLVEKKGVKYLIMAMEEIIKMYPDARLLIGGDGPEKENLVTLCRMLKLDENVKFLGYIPEDRMPQVYASADIFVLPSIVTRHGDTEGLGVVLLEAIASGIPVIGSDIGGIPDIIEDGKTGLLVEPKSADDLAKKIIFLFSNKTFSDNLTKNARDLLNVKYSWDIVTIQFSHVIRRVLEKHSLN